MIENQALRERIVGTMPYPLVEGQAASLGHLAHLVAGIRILTEMRAGEKAPTRQHVAMALNEWLSDRPEAADLQNSNAPDPRIGQQEIDWQVWPLLGRLARIAVDSPDDPGVDRFRQEIARLIDYAEVSTTPKRIDRAAGSDRGRAARRMLEIAFFGKSPQ